MRLYFRRIKANAVNLRSLQNVLPQVMENRWSIFFLLCCLLPTVLLAQHDHDHLPISSDLAFAENLGQWESKVHFRANVPGGRIWLEDDRLTYNFLHQEDIRRMHDLHHGVVPLTSEADRIVRGHAFQLQFIGAEPHPTISGHHQRDDYLNFYLGKDPSKWASNVQQYGEIAYQGVYPGIDFRLYGQGGGMKYDFIVAPGADPDLIQLAYLGVEQLEVKNHQLYITTSVNQIIEQKPYAYQLVDGKRKEVSCQFQLKEGKLSFKLGRKYRKELPLIIDPLLVFASYSGSTGDNWGFTATYDADGNTYAGGIIFGSGYPTTNGAYQTSFAGGVGTIGLGTDISISKFNSNGTGILYSTYLGGSNNEAPHSLVVNSQNELLVFGTTGSNDFPVTASSYSTQFLGGSPTPGQLVNYTVGSDIIVSKFNSTGTNLLASTYVGGSSNDGLNEAADLKYSYGDIFRGEVVVDASDNVYVASSSSSTDFPTPGSPPQGSYGGGTTDGVVFKMPPDLSALTWSTYLGGVVDDAAYAVQLDGNGDAYVVGGTNSQNFPTQGPVLNPGKLGGVDGFITHINSAGNAILASTYIGTGAYDQVYFIQLDANNNVYVLGQSEGPYPVVGNVYNNPNSGQFIHKLTNDLSSTIWSTIFGTGSGGVDLTLSAFLVNDCDQIYVSGWGGSVNVTNNGPPLSTTTGLPITSGAEQSTTDGSDFYLMVLTRDADTLLYSTFFGGNQSTEHCDGGTSRFDKNGNVYQAVCAGCGGNSDFPTTPGSWSQANNSSNCNIAVFKFDLNIVIANAQFSPVGSLCKLPAEIVLNNNSTGAAAFRWDFGDGTPEVFGANPPNHLYVAKGPYQIRLIAYDPEQCQIDDTTYIDIFVPGEMQISVDKPDTVCSGEPFFLSASSKGAVTSVLWSPAEPLDDPTISNPTGRIFEDTQFKVTLTDTSGCQGIDSVVAHVYPIPEVLAGEDLVLDHGQTSQLKGVVPPNSTYWWSPDTGLSCIDCLEPFITSESRNIRYFLHVIDEHECPGVDSVDAFLVSSIYFPNAFTPNGDDKNDVFAIYGYNIRNFDLKIFNRWGNLVYRTNQVGDGWDGKFKGKPAQIDTYVWKVNYENIYGTKFERFGQVTLVR